MSKYIFPIALIILDLRAAIVYALNKDYKMAIYWVAAAVLNICVTLGGCKNGRKVSVEKWKLKN